LSLASGWWWLYQADRTDSIKPTDIILTGEPATLVHPVVPIIQPQPARPEPTETEKKTAPDPEPARPPIGNPPRPNLAEQGRAARDRGELPAARTLLTTALQFDSHPAEAASILTDLEQLAEDTLFTGRIVEDDPLVARYMVRTGDSLVRIASEYQITPELVAKINGISNPNLIREGQSLKVIQGPFRAVVDKASYTLDLFLGDILVRRFAVGLGAEGSTPSGEWQVSTKLKNPTYYPPRGGQILAADDPRNPLGERWLGLVGLSGEAAGQQRYGIHGTIEPDSIGKDASMGCIRMRNEDVDVLYSCLVEKHSTVTVK